VPGDCFPARSSGRNAKDTSHWFNGASPHHDQLHFNIPVSSPTPPAVQRQHGAISSSSLASTWILGCRHQQLKQALAALQAELHLTEPTLPSLPLHLLDPTEPLVMHYLLSGTTDAAGFLRAVILPKFKASWRSWWLRWEEDGMSETIIRRRPEARPIRWWDV
jgi:hypothetical protein